MNSIDERVLGMKFDNNEFAKNVDGTIRQLALLKESLKLDGASAGLQGVSDAANKFSLDEPGKKVSTLAGQFTALQIAAITALSNIVNKAVDAGLQIAKSLSVAPIIDGFQEYQTNLNSIQTILANTGLKGAAGLQQVNDALNNLNNYSDKTIYNFSEMARNIGTFTAAGVKLDVATNAIKGISNLAAVSGSSAEQASTAMYQLSQALATGKVSLQDWNSVVNAGMGGEVFQKSLMETARVHGVAVDSIVKKEGSFRDSLQTGWLTSGILTETLSKFTGELTADQLKSMGYNKEQIAGILELGKTATDAATKVKTMSQLMGTLREAVGSGWAQTWQIVFGNFNEATDLFTGVNNVLGKMISDSAKARNELLQGWKDLGGRQALIDGISNAFQALLSFLRPIRDAFREIFPATTAKELYNATVAFRDFMAKLKIGADTADRLRRTFAGFFAILGIGWDLIKAGARFILDLVGSLTKGSGGFLKFTANIGDFLVSLHKAIEDGNLFTKFFGGLEKILSVPINLLHNLEGLIGRVFSRFDSSKATEAIGQVNESLKPLSDMGDKIQRIWDRVVETFHNVVAALQPVIQKVKDVAKSIGQALSNISFDDVLHGVQTGLFAGLLLLLKNFMGKFKGIKLDGGLLDGVKETIEQLTGALKGLQNALNATALLAIAAAIGILTISFIALAKLDAAGLARASTAIAIMMGELGSAFVAFSKISTGTKAARVAVMSAGLILMATAIRVLASSVEKLAGLPIQDLGKGLVAVAVLLGTLVAASNRLNTYAPGIVRTSAALILLGTAIRVLVLSVKALGGMDWITLAKGLTGVGALLGALVLFTKFVEADKVGVIQGAGIILLATALKILASAVGDFDKFNWEQIARGMSGIAVGLGLITAALNLLPEGSVFKAAGVAIIAASLKLLADGIKAMSGMQWVEIAKGLTAMAGGLVGIALALKLLPNGSLLKAASILIVASSLSMIQKALSNMAGMTWEEMAKGLISLAGALIIISAALKVVQGTLTGSAAVLVMAAALNLLIPVLKGIASMSVSDIVKSLLTLAGAFTVIGLAGLALGPVTPIIFALGVGIGLLGLAVLAAGVGVLAFAIALKVLSDAGISATDAIVGIVKGLVGLIPFVAEEIGKGLIAFAQVIATAGPAMLAAMTTILTAILQTIIDTTPKIVETLVTLLEAMLDAIVKETPKVVDAGLKMVLAVLQGIAANIKDIVVAGLAIVANFLVGLAKGLPGVISAAFDVMIAFLNGLADAIRKKGPELVQAGINVGSAIIEGIAKGLTQYQGKVFSAINSVTHGALSTALSFLGIHSPSTKFIWVAKMMMLGMANGLNDHSSLAEKAAGEVAQNVVDTMGKSLNDLSKVIGSDLIDFQPTIAPVLDLTNVKNGAMDIAALLAASQPLDFSVSAAKANAASKAVENNQNAQDNNANSGGDTYNFTQNNSSPKPLDPVEVYRQTNNLISRAKGGDSANTG